MKKSIYIILALSASTTFAALTEYKTDAGGNWSTSSTWKINPTATFPNGNTVAAVGDSPNGGTLNVDGNYTIGAYYSGYGAKKFTVSLDQNTLTLDGAGDSGKVISMWSGGTRTVDDDLTFTGGTLAFTNTSTLGESTLVVDMSKNNPTTFVKRLTFDSTVTSTEHMKFSGYTQTSAVFTLAKGFNAINGSDTKNITVSNATGILGGAISNADSLYLANTSSFTVNKGATLNLAPTSPLLTSSTKYVVCIDKASTLQVEALSMLSLRHRLTV